MQLPDYGWMSRRNTHLRAQSKVQRSRTPVGKLSGHFVVLDIGESDLLALRQGNPLRIPYTPGQYAMDCCRSGSDPKYGFVSELTAVWLWEEGGLSETSVSLTVYS